MTAFICQAWAGSFCTEKSDFFEIWHIFDPASALERRPVLPNSSSFVRMQVSWATGFANIRRLEFYGELPSVLGGGTAMNELHQLAQLIVSCWKMSGQTGRIPTSHGMLDRALQSVVERGGFPDWAKRNLTFVDSRIGLQCVELPGILEWAQRAQLTSAPNPSYETTEVQVSDRVASRLLRDLNVPIDAAGEWGKMLREATDDAKAAFAGVDHALIEEY